MFEAKNAAIGAEAAYIRLQYQNFVRGDIHMCLKSLFHDNDCIWIILIIIVLICCCGD